METLPHSVKKEIKIEQTDPVGITMQNPFRSYLEYLKITDEQHLANIKRNPVHFLVHSGNGMFVEKEGYAIAVRDELRDIFQNNAFERHYRDIIAYRTMDYYRRRYVASCEDAVFLFRNLPTSLGN